jgi:hypothetical protein
VSFRPKKFSARTRNLGLTQVASLASRHEQITVCAAFFCPRRVFASNFGMKSPYPAMLLLYDYDT